MGEVRTTHFSTEDPDQALEALGQVYARLRMYPPAGARFWMELASVSLGAVSVETVRMRCPPVSGGLDGTGVVRVGHLRSGRFSVVTDHHPIRSTPVFLFPTRPYTGWWEELGLTTVSLPLGVVEDHARALLDDPGFRLRFTGYRPRVDPRFWRATVRYLIEDVLPAEVAFDSPVLRDQSVRSLITALLHTMPSTFTEHPAGSSSTGAVTAPVRRAVAFIDAHLAEPIGVAEIAAAARLSPRGLQAAFRRALDTTPTAYLHTVRLAAAHTDLLQADPTDGATVAAIAARWGFAHRGRFAAAYRRVYGESPATTLQR